MDPNKIKIHIWQEYWAPIDCMNYSSYIFVYGDNNERVGNAGQAIIRHCENAMGIRTKVTPGVRDFDYFTDEDFDKYSKWIDEDIEAIKQLYHIGNYTGIVFPKNGLGTGLAELPFRAPKLFSYLNDRLDMVFFGPQLEKNNAEINAELNRFNNDMRSTHNHNRLTTVINKGDGT